MSQSVLSKSVSEKNKSNFITRLYKDNKQNLDYLDWPIFILVIILSLIGLVAIFSATMYKNSIDDVVTQFVSMLMGIGFVLLMTFIPIKWIKDLKTMLFSNLVVIGLLIYTLINGEVVNGAQSWINIIITFQPSELYKVTSILLIAWLADYVNREEILSRRKVAPKFWIVVVLIYFSGLGLIIGQPDFGMAAIIGGTTFIVYSLLLASPKKNLLFYTGVFVLYLIFYFLASQNTEWLMNQNSHVLNRIAVFINPFLYPEDAGYQLIEGFKAIQAGGLFGAGLGNGQAKYANLPAIETDFIIANIAEETGLIGVLIILALFFTLILFLYQRAARSRNLQERTIIIGVATMMLTQILINIGGMLSLIPLTGVTLPFISYGGTSLVVSYIMIGLALRMIVESKKALAKEQVKSAHKISLVYSRKDV